MEYNFGRSEGISPSVLEHEDAIKIRIIIPMYQRDVIFKFLTKGSNRILIFSVSFLSR